MRLHMPVRQLFVEPLENRAVLAGNVLAQMVDSTLFITGDEFDNHVGIVSTLGGEVTVGGFFETAINGNTGPATFSGVARIEVVGGDGNDGVGATLDETVGELRINTGPGRDGVIVSTSGGDVFIDTGDGADVASVRSVSGFSGGGDVQIATGNGNDLVALDLLYHSGAVHVDTGNGNDDVHAFFEQSEGNLSIFTGNGNDTVSLYTFHLVNFDGDLTVDGGNGVDELLGNPHAFTGDVDLLNFEI